MKLTFVGLSLLAGLLQLPVSQSLITQPQSQQLDTSAAQVLPSQKVQQQTEATVAENADQTEGALFGVTVNGKYGFMDKHGNLVIQPKYENTFPFSDGLAAVQVGNLWGYIDRHDTMIIEPQFIQVGLFSHGYAPVKLQHQYLKGWGYIDTKGKLVIEPQFDHVERFHNGIAKVGMETVRGILFSMFADVGTEHEYHYIDIRGQKVPEPAPEHYATGKPGELIPFRQGELVGYVDATGEVVIKPQFIMGSEFSDGLAAARKDRLLGYIDRTGAFVIPPSFEYGNEFSDGLAGVQLPEGKWGFIDKAGQVVIPGPYNWVYGGFREGVAQVTVEGRMRYINKNGEWVW